MEVYSVVEFVVYLNFFFDVYLVVVLFFLGFLLIEVFEIDEKSLSLFYSEYNIVVYDVVFF